MLPPSVWGQSELPSTCHPGTHHPGLHRDALTDSTEHPWRGARSGASLVPWTHLPLAWSRQALHSRCRVGRCSLLGVELNSMTVAERGSGAGQHLPWGSVQGQSAGLLCNCGVVAAITFSSLCRGTELFLQKHARKCSHNEKSQGLSELRLSELGANGGAGKARCLLPSSSTSSIERGRDVRANSWGLQAGGDLWLG